MKNRNRLKNKYRMEEMTVEELEFVNSMALINSIAEKGKADLTDSLSFVKAFSDKYNELSYLRPYHMNVIDEIRANENAHSRILAQVLRYKDNKGEFILLKSFLNNLCGFQLDVTNPRVEKVDSCGRIDIPIFDDNYAVIIENKVSDKAPDQNNEAGGQIARYIETIKNAYQRKLKNIYVVYTPRYTRECEEDCWKIKYKKDGEVSEINYKKDFAQRYCSISYRDKILGWLKDTVLPEVEDMKFMYSAIIQYIDHLEGEFYLRNIDKKFNMRIQEFIKDKLGLDDYNTDESIAILTTKEKELNNALIQISNLKQEYRKKPVKDRFEKWGENIKKDFPELENMGDSKFTYGIILDIFERNAHIINLAYKFQYGKKNYSVLIECKIEGDKKELYYGMGIHHFGMSKKHINIPAELGEIIKHDLGFKESGWWYGWKHCDFEDGYELLKRLIEKVQCLTKSDK